MFYLLAKFASLNGTSAIQWQNHCISVILFIFRKSSTITNVLLAIVAFKFVFVGRNAVKGLASQRQTLAARGSHHSTCSRMTIFVTELKKRALTRRVLKHALTS